jgi:Tol biopolymer transport system component
LAKNPEDRLQSAKDLRNDLRELKQDVDSGEFQESIPVAAPRKMWPVVAAVLAAALIAGTIGYLFRPSDVSEGTSVPVSGGALVRVTSQPGEELYPSLSPDGDYVVFASPASGNWDIYTQRIGGQTSFSLTKDCMDDDRMPAFSPDGEWIVFRSEREGGGLFLMGATGESVRRLTDFGYDPAWSPDGTEVVFATEGIYVPGLRWYKSQLWVVNVSSAEKRLVTEGDAVQPSWSPHGDRIAYWVGFEIGQRDIRTMPAHGGEAVPVTEDAHVDWNPVWSPDGKHIYFSSDRGGNMNLWRAPIEEDSGKALGPPEPVTTGASAIRQHPVLAEDGTQLAYVERAESRGIWKAPFDTTTSTVEGEPIQAIQSTRLLNDPHVSPDGEWLTYSSSEPEDIFIMRVDGTSGRQLTDDLYLDRTPRWSPDGEKITFYSNRSGVFEIWAIHADGSELQQLTKTPDQALTMPEWSPDGQRIRYFDSTGRTSYIFDPNKPWEEQTHLALPPLSDEGEWFLGWSWSRDGKRIAGVAYSDWSSPGEIVICSQESQKYRRLSQLGADPVWLPDGRRLLFRTPSGSLKLLDINAGKAQEILSLFPDNISRPVLSPDGRSLYFTRESAEADIWLLTLDKGQ